MDVFTRANFQIWIAAQKCSRSPLSASKLLNAYVWFVYSSSNPPTINKWCCVMHGTCKGIWRTEVWEGGWGVVVVVKFGSLTLARHHVLCKCTSDSSGYPMRHFYRVEIESWMVAATELWTLILGSRLSKCTQFYGQTHRWIYLLIILCGTSFHSLTFKCLVKQFASWQAGAVDTVMNCEMCAFQAGAPTC